MRALKIRISFSVTLARLFLHPEGTWTSVNSADSPWAVGVTSEARYPVDSCEAFKDNDTAMALTLKDGIGE